MKQEIKELMLKAIEEERGPEIERKCRKIWNQPFFYKIDRAKVLTISYNPTDKGARMNYPEYLTKYQNGYKPTSEELYELLYNYKKEHHWRKNYDIIFEKMGYDVDDEIAHMDISSFPYDNFNDFIECKYIDNSKSFVFKCIDILKEQLDFIMIDGKRNKQTLNYFLPNYNLMNKTMMPINKRGTLYELWIYKHKEYDTFLIYYGCQLFGQTTPAKEYVEEVAKYIKRITKEN